MYKTIALLLSIVCFLPTMADTSEPDTNSTDANDVKTLFSLTMTIVRPLPILSNHRGMPSGNWRPPEAIYVRQYLSPPHIALTAGHCLLTPPKGKPDKAITLCFVAQKGIWRYEIHGIEGLVEPSLGRRLKAEGDGWIVLPTAVSWDFGLVILRYPPSGITPVP